MERYQHIPYRDDGRDARGCDCWGFYRLIAIEQFGFEPPLYPDVPVKDLMQVLDVMESASKVYRRVRQGDERGGDCVRLTRLVKLAGGSIRFLPLHVGIVPWPGFVFHMECGAGPVLLPLDHFKVKRRTEGIYRDEHSPRLA